MKRSYPLIYSLFPRLVGPMSLWTKHSARAKAMGFNWVYLNPLHYPGFSGSLYAVKDFYALNPLFIDENDPNEPIKQLRLMIDKMHDQGLKVMMDLVINHTSKDSPLIKDHPTWFRWKEDGEVLSPSAIDPSDSRKVTVWGDLAEVDNANSSDRESLWAYWTALVQYYLDLGFDGFRCDAAYKVPAQLWKLLISAAHQRKADVLFAAETLGCRLAEVRNLRAAGFDYLFNSSKWWNFDQEWALEQHQEFAPIAPSISFAESHDTERLYAETKENLAVQKQRYFFSAIFSSALLMPIGYEYCFQKKMNVVQTYPNDWEETHLDLSDFIRRVNLLIEKIAVLSDEGHWELKTSYHEPTIILEKKCRDHKNECAPLIVVINKDWHQKQSIQLSEMEDFSGKEIIRTFGEQTIIQSLSNNKVVDLEAAEIVLIRSR